MTTTIETVNRVAAALKGTVRTPRSSTGIRVYLPNNWGYIEIGDAGRANIEHVKRAAFERTREVLTALGITTYRAR